MLNSGGDYGSKEEFQFTVGGDSLTVQPTSPPSDTPSSNPSKAPTKQPSSEPTEPPSTESPSTDNPSTSNPTTNPIMLDLPFETPRLPASSSVDSQITSLYPTSEDLFTTSSVSLERPAELQGALLSDDSNDIAMSTTTSTESPTEVNTTIVDTDAEVGGTNGTESAVVSSAYAETSSAGSIQICTWYVIHVGVSSLSAAWLVLW